MASTASPAAANAALQQAHRRNRSAVLKSIIVPKNHKRAPSDGTALSTPADMLPAMPLLPPDHPHSQLRPTRSEDKALPDSPPSPRKGPAPASRGLHKKTLSSVSLRSLGKEKKEKQGEGDGRTRESSRVRDEDTAMSPKPKKTKSSANLATMFGKSRSKIATPGKDKENTTPPTSAQAATPVQTPIWAQFSSQANDFEEVTTTSKVPLNDRHSVEEEIRLYTPAEYSPSKQRNFCDYGQPALQKRPAMKDRPKSTIAAGGASAKSLLDAFGRKHSNDRVPLGDTQGNEGRPAGGAVQRNTLRRTSSDSGKRRPEPAKSAGSPTKKPNRVMAAVAAFNGRNKDVPAANARSKPDPRAVEAEFEAVLESRNIPQHQRAAMRTLKLDVKADFVRTHKLDTPSVSRTTSAQSAVPASPEKKSAKSTMSRGAPCREGSDEEKSPVDGNATDTSTKRERPRSRTFTFSKGDSPVKKQKAEKPPNERKISSKSTPIPKSPSTRSLASVGSGKSSKGLGSPDDFVKYMRKTTKPQDVEVGKLHKLRQLLRNETVEWVDDFIQIGGMTELVELLYRIMAVEWREDHEDQLLHEVLRCLKGLCTTDSALKQLADIASKLYPALLGMLFDEEHKGPSEFTTREFIVQIIFAHLETAPESERPVRARELLKYLKDPVKEKESSTVPFILQMHQPRPFQVWCKEITNVTKEVFWIFIHHLNVLPLPKPSEDEASQSFCAKHFPGQRAIVPAAPYVGGVEWDATNYVATHLDLINGLIASLPTRDARNTLRSEFKVSGMEKLIGHLRTCNPKYYGAVHDAVKVWIGAGAEDGWDVKAVRMGSGESKGPSPVKSSPAKKKVDDAPKLKAPSVDVGMGLGLGLGFEKEVGKGKGDDDWI